MLTTITYNACRGTLGDDTTDAQYAAFKQCARARLERDFPGADVEVGDSDFCNASIVNVSSDITDVAELITESDVREALHHVDNSWLDAK